MATLRILIIVAMPVLLGACSSPSHAIRAGLDSINPGLAAPAGPLPFLAVGRSTGGDGKSKPTRVKASGSEARAGSAAGPAGEAGGRVDRLPAGVVQPVAAEVFGGQSVSMVPASGDQRARLVRSAGRLVGIRNSFDSRSFLGHLLAICDLLPAGRTSAGWTARDQLELARDAGTYRDGPGGAQPGDIVYFKCGSACGADAADGVGAGVVVESADGRVVAITYRDGEVKRLEIDRNEQDGYSAP